MALELLQAREKERIVPDAPVFFLPLSQSVQSVAMARRHCLFHRKALGAGAPSAVDVLSLCFCAFVCSVTNGPHYGLTLNEMLIDWPVSSWVHGATAATVGKIAFKYAPSQSAGTFGCFIGARGN